MRAAIIAFLFIVVPLVLRAIARAEAQRRREAAYNRAIWPERAE